MEASKKKKKRETIGIGSEDAFKMYTHSSVYVNVLCGAYFEQWRLRSENSDANELNLFADGTFRLKILQTIAHYYCGLNVFRSNPIWFPRSLSLWMCVFV